MNNKDILGYSLRLLKYLQGSENSRKSTKHMTLTTPLSDILICLKLRNMLIPSQITTGPILNIDNPIDKYRPINFFLLIPNEVY